MLLVILDRVVDELRMNPQEVSSRIVVSAIESLGWDPVMHDQKFHLVVLQGVCHEASMFVDTMEHVDYPVFESRTRQSHL